MAKKSKNASASIDPHLNLGQLSDMYVKHMEKDDKSPGTIFSYGMELKTATAVLGADRLVSDITPALIESFNNCDRVMLLRSGKSKAEPSFMKTRRVLRLALTWAAQSGLIERAPYPTKNEPGPEPTAPAKPEKKTRKAKPVMIETPAPAA